MSKTTYAYPVGKLCGKISRHSDIIHACTASGKQITYLQGQRDLNAHPVTTNELAANDLFKRRQMAVAARVSKKAPTYAEDMIAYREQYETGYKSYRSYIWSLVKAEIAE